MTEIQQHDEAAADMYACLCPRCEADAAADMKAEMDAEGAWLRAAENAGYDEARNEEEDEARRGVVSFADAMRNAEAMARDNIPF